MNIIARRKNTWCFLLLVSLLFHHVLQILYSCLETHIESFANELFLEIFKYLIASNIYYGFHGLNKRFDTLILEYFRTCDIDFSFANITFRKQSIELVHCVCSMAMIRLFKLNQSHRWQSFLLSNIRSCTLINTIIVDLPSVSSLIHLTVEQCYFSSEENQEDAEKTTNIIWSLPKLVQLCFRSKYKYRRDQSISLRPTITLTTLQRVLIIGLRPCRVPLDQLFWHTPCLRQLVLDK